jgi:cyclophilin family peptidyl-prolyl cis-trans isomerase
MRTFLLFILLLLTACTPFPGARRTNPLLTPSDPAVNLTAPPLYHVRLHTTQGDILIEVHRDWAPRGADRFYNLVKNGYYNDNKVWRIRAGYWAQFGINGDPNISTPWRNATMPDDPRTQSNTRGTIAFAFALPNARTTQVFINLRDNSSTHDHPQDGIPFAPFGKIIQGLDVADKWYADYAETAGGGIRGGKQDILFQQGNPYWEKSFPKLDTILKATIESLPPR